LQILVRLHCLKCHENCPVGAELFHTDGQTGGPGAADIRFSRLFNER
jgi:ferredoxin